MLSAAPTSRSGLLRARCPSGLRAPLPRHAPQAAWRPPTAHKRRRPRPRTEAPRAMRDSRARDRRTVPSGSRRSADSDTTTRDYRRPGRADSRSTPPRRHGKTLARRRDCARSCAGGSANRSRALQPPRSSRSSRDGSGAGRRRYRVGGRQPGWSSGRLISMQPQLCCGGCRIGLGHSAWTSPSASRGGAQSAAGLASRSPTQHRGFRI